MKRLIKRWAAPVVCGLFIFALFRFVFFIGYVPTESMEPAIKAGSVITGSRIVGEIKYGDVIVFSHDGFMLVKRVAAVPGDIVYIGDFGSVISVNDILPDSELILTVPEGCYFMLGDNAEYSVDSRRWDEPFVSRNRIIAKLPGK